MINRGYIYIVDTEVANPSGESLIWRAIRLTEDSTDGGNWISAGDDSIVEYTTDSLTYTGGRIIASGYVMSTKQSKSSTGPYTFSLHNPISVNADGTSSDVFIIEARSIGPSAEALAAINWLEVI